MDQIKEAILAEYRAKMDRSQYIKLKWLSHHETIPALGADNEDIKIPSYGNFFSYYMGAQYTTQNAGAVDGGACQISLKILDTGRNYLIFDDFIPMSMYSSPGRQRVSTVAGDPSQMLFGPIEFEHPFLAGSTINVSWSSSSDAENDFWIVFYGDQTNDKYRPENVL